MLFIFFIWQRKVKVKLLSHVWLFATPWTIAYQVPPSMGFSRQEYWGGLPFPSPGDLPNPGIEPGSPPLKADTLPSEPPGKSSTLSYLQNSRSVVFTVACRIFSCSLSTTSCGMWGLVPHPGVEPGPSALGLGSLSHWTTREVIICTVLKLMFWWCVWRSIQRVRKLEPMNG